MTTVASDCGRNTGTEDCRSSMQHEPRTWRQASEHVAQTHHFEILWHRPASLNLSLRGVPREIVLLCEIAEIISENYR